MSPNVLVHLDISANGTWHNVYVTNFKYVCFCICIRSMSKNSEDGINMLDGWTKVFDKRFELINKNYIL